VLVVCCAQSGGVLGVVMSLLVGAGLSGRVGGRLVCVIGSCLLYSFLGLLVVSVKVGGLMDEYVIRVCGRERLGDLKIQSFPCES
jgi:hypothetical protein